MKNLILKGQNDTGCAAPFMPIQFPKNPSLKIAKGSVQASFQVEFILFLGFNFQFATRRNCRGMVSVHPSALRTARSGLTPILIPFRRFPVGSPPDFIPVFFSKNL